MNTPKNRKRNATVVALVVVVGGLLYLDQLNALRKATTPDEPGFLKAAKAQVYATTFWTDDLLLDTGHTACSDLKKSGGDVTPILEQMAAGLDAAGVQGIEREMYVHDITAIMEAADWWLCR